MDQPDHIPVPTRVNTRSSLACLQCRSKHIKCDGKKPHCSKCIALDKQCQYTASRRGGLDRATLSERRKRLARGNEARADHATQIATKTNQGVGFTNSRAQSIITLDSVDCGFNRDLSAGTPPSFFAEGSQVTPENLAEDPLINSYYTNFHHLHPFAPPQPHFMRLCQSPQEGSLHFTSLAAVMRLIGNLYMTHEWSLPLQSEVETRISQLHSSNPVQVQCRLLYSIALFWSNFRSEADGEIGTARDVALNLGMHRQEYATADGFGDEVLMESWRRTWWMLYIVDAYYAGTLGTLNLKVFHIEASVDLPCEESEYESGVIPTPCTIEDFNSREFFDEEVTFSSFTYLIGAVKCAAFAISTSPKNATRQDSEHIIQAADSAIDAWLLLLPKEQKPVMRSDGTTDELMFQAYMLVYVATIGLHRPLSDLRFNPVESVSSCAREPPPETPKPDLINVHTRRILNSVNAQIQLLALPVRPFHHTPFTTCMMSEGTLALLSACRYLLQDKALAIARDQIRLSIGCLKALGEVWPRTAKNVKEIQTIARHVLVTKGGTASDPTPSSSGPSSLMGSDGQTSTETLDVMRQADDLLASLGPLEDICGWFNMGSELNADAWVTGGT
ncbi:hypothetical protein BKA59DRAFT_472028 [Fusarium tricinctum]|uniref:Zn(2)-C6 fungal-type domain-containing protein n=1 Tax=Fusarium tricinctum TaxID=61284 RepID=A0A8K0S0C4_9HYPO|nr:hypothetical protein BKA59DRAFT_472028 [Fusarium tricinctum]